MDLLWKALLALALAAALAGFAAWKRALTPGGLALAGALALCIGFCGGVSAFAVLAATFFCTVAAGKLSGAVGAEIGLRLHEKAGARDAVQIVCNVLVGALSLALAALTGLEVFVWCYGGAMASSLADSMASELGVLSRTPPRDILTRRRVTPGLSGGVTALGLGASALGAAIIGGLYGALRVSLPLALTCTAAGFLAALADSILGSCVQVKYRCPVCGALTEKPVHCGEPGKPERGARWMTNDAVNFLGNLAGAALAAAGYALWSSAL